MTSEILTDSSENHSAEKKLGVIIFNKEVSLIVPDHQMARIEQFVLGHKAGLAIAATLGLATTAAVLLQKHTEPSSQIKSDERKRIFENAVPLTSEEAASFNDFFELTIGLAWTRAINFGGSFHDNHITKDIVAQTYTGLLAHWPDYFSKPHDELMAILTSSLMNNERNWRRSAKRSSIVSSLESHLDNKPIRDQFEHDLSRNQVSVEEEVLIALGQTEEHEVTETIVSYLDSLEPRRKLVTILRMAGFDFATLGEIIGLNTVATKQVWVRVALAIRKKIEEARRSSNNETRRQAA